jgi:hypothetical protein
MADSSGWLERPADAGNANSFAPAFESSGRPVVPWTSWRCSSRSVTAAPGRSTSSTGFDPVVQGSSVACRSGFFLLFAAGLIACTGTPPEAPEAAGDVMPRPGIRFDPATIQVGTTFGDLRAIDVSVAPSQVAGEYVGSVEFAGSVRLKGPPIVLEDGGPPFICFQVADESAGLLPRMAHDDRNVWFCFDNQELALAELGDRIRQRVEVVVSRYRTVYQYTDAHDSAWLEDVVEE